MFWNTRGTEIVDPHSSKSALSACLVPVGITKQIQFLIQGLGKYTVECGMIYLNSLLRSSILFAAETMYNIKENEYRKLERIEEEMLRKLFKSVKGCPIYQLYLESGHLPARFHIKRIKLVFYKYILSQNEKSLLFTFLMAQKKHPKKGDWYSEIQCILKEFELNLCEEDIKRIPTTTFKNMVKTSAKDTGFKYLQNIQVRGQREEKFNMIHYHFKII